MKDGFEQFLLRSAKRGLIAYGHDIVMAAVSFLAAIYLRMGNLGLWPDTETLLQGTVVFVVIATTVFHFAGLYRGVWRYASTRDLVAITKAVSLVILLFLTVMFFWTRLDQIPRSVPVINWFILMTLLGGTRFVYRMIRDRSLTPNLSLARDRSIPVVLVGAGDETDLFIRAAARSTSPYKPVAILANRPGRIGREIHGVLVIGTHADLETAVRQLAAKGQRPQRLILTRRQTDGAVVRDLLDRAAKLGMTLARLPEITDFRTEDGSPLEVKPINVEDLLGRPQTPLDRDAMRALIHGRRVLVTGAGGSIGSELARQAAGFGPAELWLVENNEYALYSIERELAEGHPDLRLQPVIADVRDADRVRQVLATATPELVFHAAALKHVPLVEANPLEGVLTNVVGTAHVANACLETGVATMVLVSTDKAVNPTSVMGATKRAAERYCQALDGSGGTRFVAVRFGNVLGSTGSVVPLFQRQLAAGGPLTVTHPDMARYFMTVREAVELILQATAYALDHADTKGRIFVLDMGEPVRILDLARQMIRLAGFDPEKDVGIAFTGIRPGEKLYEEIFHGSEAPVATGQPGVLLAQPRDDDGTPVKQEVSAMAAAARLGEGGHALTLLHGMVPEYTGNALPTVLRTPEEGPRLAVES